MTTTHTPADPADTAARIGLLETKALLSALWLVVLFNLIFRDLHEIVKSDFLEAALGGTYYGQQVTEVMFLIGGILVEIPILMMLLTWVLPPRANRWANMIVAGLWAVLVIVGDILDLDDVFHASVETVALAVIIWQAWRWRNPG